MISGGGTPPTSVFFCGIYRKMGVAKMCRLEKFQIFQISNASIFFRRPFQTKNPREKTKISARCARRHGQEERKNRRKSFLIFVSSDRKPHKGVFRRICVETEGRGAFSDCFCASEASMLWKDGHFEQKVLAKWTL